MTYCPGAFVVAGNPPNQRLDCLTNILKVYNIVYFAHIDETALREARKHMLSIRLGASRKTHWRHLYPTTACGFGWQILAQLVQYINKIGVSIIGKRDEQRDDPISHLLHGGFKPQWAH